MSRPEHIAPPEIFYNDDEAQKYASNSRMITIQSAMTERAIELLNLSTRSCHILDVGCGSGLSGEVLTSQGHYWVGYDISASMLAVAASREVEGDLFLSDIGQGVSFRPGTFDACVSISAIQWLCNADASNHVPQKRLSKFFQSLYICLKRGARAVFQLYPETPQQMELITTAAIRCGFGGGVVVDYPHSTKAKKYFLVLFAGVSVLSSSMPKAINADDKAVQRNDTIRFSGADIQSGANSHSGYHKMRKSKRFVKTRDWVLRKKESRRRQGKHTTGDSKFTNRRRKPVF